MFFKKNNSHFSDGSSAMVQEELVKLTKKLITYETIADKPAELKKCADFIEDYFKSLNKKYAAGLQIIRIVNNNKPSIIVTFHTTKNPILFLNGHFDVVHGDKAQFDPLQKEDKIIGRGAADMKAGVAIIMQLFLELCKKGIKPNIGAMLVSDEEKGSYDTTPHIVKKGYLPKFFITTESSDENIGYAAKGVIGVTVNIKGKPCHASMPWLGKDPVEMFLQDYAKLRKKIKNPVRPEFKRTMCLTVIKAGDSSNRIADSLFAKINIRTTSDSEQKKTVRLIREVFKDHEVNLTVESGVNNYRENPYLKELAESYQKVTGKRMQYMKDHGASDARFFARKKIPAVTFGPHGRDLHGTNEWVSISSMKTVYDVLYSMTRKM